MHSRSGAKQFPCCCVQRLHPCRPFTIPFIFFTWEKRSPCSCQKLTGPTRPCTHVCPPNPCSSITTDFSHCFKFLKQRDLELFLISNIKHVPSPVSMKNVTARISKVAMGNECGGPSDRRWSLSAYSDRVQTKFIRHHLSFTDFFSHLKQVVLISTTLFFCKKEKKNHA